MNYILLLSSVIFFANAHAVSPINKITLKKGETYHLELPSNPTTGYSWYLAKDIPVNAPIRIIKTEYSPQKTNLVGSGGIQYWDIKGVKKGVCTVALEYKRPWEKNTKPADVKQMIITVK